MLKRFRSTVKRFDNQQSSNTLHAKLSKGEKSAICNISHLSLQYCSAFNPDCHFLWRSLPGILISRRYYISFEKTSSCFLFLSKCIKYLLPKEGKKKWCFIFFTGKCMDDFPAVDIALQRPHYFLWDYDMLSVPYSSAKSDNYLMTRLKDCGSLGLLSWLKGALHDPIRRVIRVMLPPQIVRIRESGRESECNLF